jgi:hypothetical protein
VCKQAHASLGVAKAAENKWLHELVAAAAEEEPSAWVVVCVERCIAALSSPSSRHWCALCIQSRILTIMTVLIHMIGTNTFVFQHFRHEFAACLIEQQVLALHTVTASFGQAYQTTWGAWRLH